MRPGSPARWAIGKGLNDESRAETRPLHTSKLSPRVWGEFEESACAANDVARDPEALKEAAMAALRVDATKRSDADVVAIGDWIMQTDHVLAPIFDTWRQSWNQDAKSKEVLARKGQENALSPSNVAKRDPAAVLRGNPAAAACFRGVQLLKQAVGALIYKEGDAGDSLYAVIDGRIGMWKRSAADTSDMQPAETRKLSAMSIGAGSVRFGSDELWRFGVKLAVLSPGEVFGEASVGLGFKRLETAVVANCEVGEAKLLVFPGAVYRSHMQPLFAPFWAEIQKRESVLRSVPYHFAEWSKEALFTIAYWQLAQPLKDGRILYKEDDVIESVYWLAEGAVTVTCEINVLDSSSAFDFGAFVTSTAMSTSAAAPVATGKRQSRLTKLRGMLQAAFAFKKVRWSVKFDDASAESCNEPPPTSLFPDADCRVVLDYVRSPEIFGDFEVLRQDSMRRTTVHSSSSKTLLYRISKALFKLLVMENAASHTHGTPAALKTRCDLLSKWFEVRASREGMQSVPVPWLCVIKNKFIGCMKQELAGAAANNRRASHGRRSSGSLAASLRRRSVDRRKSDDSPKDYDGLLLSIDNPYPASPSTTPLSTSGLFAALKTPPPSISPSLFDGPRALIMSTRMELVNAKRVTATLKHVLFKSPWFTRIRALVGGRHSHLTVIRGSGNALNVDLELEDSDDIDWTEELAQVESAVPRKLHSPSGDLMRKHEVKRGSSRRLVHGLSHTNIDGVAKPLLALPKSLHGLGSFRGSVVDESDPPRPVVHFLSHSHLAKDSDGSGATTNVMTPDRHPSMNDITATALAFSAIKDTHVFSDDAVDSFLGDIDTNPGHPPLHPSDIGRPSSLPKPCLRSPGRPRSRGRTSSLEEPLGASGGPVRMSDAPVCNNLTPSPIISPRGMNMRKPSRVHFGSEANTSVLDHGPRDSTLADAGRHGILSNAFSNDATSKPRPVSRQTIGGVTARNLGPLKPIPGPTGTPVKRPSTRGLSPSAPNGSVNIAVLPRVSAVPKPSVPFRMPSRSVITSPSQRISASPVTTPDMMMGTGRASTPALRPLTSKSHGIGECDQLTELLVSTSLTKHGIGRKL